MVIALRARAPYPPQMELGAPTQPILNKISIQQVARQGAETLVRNDKWQGAYYDTGATDAKGAKVLLASDPVVFPTEMNSGQDDILSSRRG
jgi:hypothetical protein